MLNHNNKHVVPCLPLVVCIKKFEQSLLTFSHNRQAGNKDPNQNLWVLLVPQCVPKIPTDSNVKKKYTCELSEVFFRGLLTSVFPLKSCTGSSLPAEYAKVQRAQADLSSNPARSLYKPREYSE